MIILLDLNYTLVANSEKKASPFTRQIEGEEYRQDLVELIKPAYVILMTARPEKHREATLKSIKAKTGWLPQEAFFNIRNLRPPEAKERMLLDLVFPSHGEDPDQYYAIESNPATRGMYKRYGIKAFAVDYIQNLKI